jgi:arginine-tRNA-protein transferase
LFRQLGCRYFTCLAISCLDEFGFRRMTSRDKTDIVIIDETEPCPYLPGQTARMPLRMPLRAIDPEFADRLLAEGNRRTGEFVYSTHCPRCHACEPIRIDCTEFQFSKNHKRVLSRGNSRYRQQIGALVADEARVELFNKHRLLRGLATQDKEIDLDEYHWGFVRSCFQSFELAYVDHLGKLVCLSVCDRGRQSMSAVYTYFDPELQRESLGTYAILRQVEYCRQENLRYLYLGYYVRNSEHMKYKARFLPHERLVHGRWVRYADVAMDNGGVGD